MRRRSRRPRRGGRDAFRWVSCIVPARHETHRNATRERPCSRSSSDRCARRRAPRRAQAKARSPQGRTLESNHFSWSDRACQLHSLRADDGAIGSTFCYLWASLVWTCLGIRALGPTVSKAVFAAIRHSEHVITAGPKAERATHGGNAGHSQAQGWPLDGRPHMAHVST